MPIRRRAACIIGQQPCLDEWVLGKGLVVRANGEIIPPQESRYSALLGGESGNVPAQDIIPVFYTPLSSDALRGLLSLMRLALRHNYSSALLVVAGGVMALHYTTITAMFGGCPVVVALDPAEAGKRQP